MHVFKILRIDEWTAFEATGSFDGSADDRRDGFIHLSAVEQVAATHAKYFAETATVYLTLDAARLGPALKWEASRGGALFPHLYRALDRADVVAVSDAPPPAPD